MFIDEEFRDFDPTNEDDGILMAGLLTRQTKNMGSMSSIKSILKITRKKNKPRYKIFIFHKIHGIAALNDDSIIEVYIENGIPYTSEFKVKLEDALIDAYSSSSIQPRAIKIL